MLTPADKKEIVEALQFAIGTQQVYIDDVANKLVELINSYNDLVADYTQLRVLLQQRGILSLDDFATT